MANTTTSPQADFAAATAWLAAAPDTVRATVERHLQHHKISPASGAALSTPAQLAMIEKALGEHHAVLLPSFRQAYVARTASLPAATLGYVARKLIGEDDTFLRTHTGCAITSLDATLGYATIVLPASLADKAAATAYARSLFASRSVVASDAPIDGHYHITLPVYDVKRDVDRIRKPVGFRAMPTRSADERMVMEEEFRVLMGKDAPPHEREMEALVQDVGMKKALEELTRDYRLMFADNLREGVYRFPIHTKDALIARSVQAMMADGRLTASDAAITGHGSDMHLHITPHGLVALEQVMFEGIKGTTPSILSADAQQARRHYFDGLATDEARRDIMKRQLASFSASERATVADAIKARELPVDGALPQQRAALTHIGNAIEHTASAREAHAVNDAPRYEQDAMRRAIAFAAAVLKEDRLWTHLDNSQLASHHNTIREDHREALSQLDTLLSTQHFSQAGLAQLVAMPRFADAIRDSGHFLSIVAQHDSKQSKAPLADAAAYARAFHLSDAAMVPQSNEAKSASYHLRSMIGDVGFGEVVGRNIFMGLRPIFTSVELAVKKPVLCGATILGIAAYSSVVPKQYSIPRLLNNLMHQIIEGLGIPHGEDSKGAQKLVQLAENAVEDIKKSGGGDSFKKGFTIGRKFGVGQTAAVGAGAFVAFNLVEDVIVHLPLALVSVGVGAAGGATGRKVLSPVFNDLGDIAGRFSPEPVREMWRQDVKSLKQFGEQPWLSRISHGTKSLAHDVDEFGIIVTGRHAVNSAVDGLSSLLGSVMGQSKPAVTVQGPARG